MERRYINRATEVNEEGRMIKGYSAVFGDVYEMWEGYKETIDRSAFEGCDMSDVVALFNHENEYLLARKIGEEGTLRLKVDDKGLYFEFEAPKTTIGNDVLENVKLGNIRGCSFAFTVKEQNIEEFEDGTCIRTIKKIGKLYDVGPVVNPAYEKTEIEAYKRSIDSQKQEKPHQVSDIYYTELQFKLKK